METKTDVTVLEHIMALNLEVNIWTARKKLSPADFGETRLPPEDLASLGSKRVCNPEELRIFGTLKSRAFNMLDRQGVRFLSGWAIAEDAAEQIGEELGLIRDEFLVAKERFLARYDEAVSDWIALHPGWEELIGSSKVSVDYVCRKIGFKWQMFKLVPPAGETVHHGLEKEVHDLGGTLFGEIAKAATETWHRCYEGKEQVTHKALSPLRAIYEKLLGLSFMEPRVLPVTDLLQTAFNKISRRGLIHGADLLMLQGVVSLLRDPETLVAHGQKILDGTTASHLLQSLVARQQIASVDPAGNLRPAGTGFSSPRIESQGLW